MVLGACTHMSASCYAPEDEHIAFIETVFGEHVTQSAHAEHVTDTGGCRVVLAKAAEHPVGLRSSPARGSGS